jgi:hypothetical protein
MSGATHEHEKFVVGEPNDTFYRFTNINEVSTEQTTVSNITFNVDFPDRSGDQHNTNGHSVVVTNDNIDILVRNSVDRIEHPDGSIEIVHVNTNPGNNDIF